MSQLPEIITFAAFPRLFAPAPDHTIIIDTTAAAYFRRHGQSKIPEHIKFPLLYAAIVAGAERGGVTLRDQPNSYCGGVIAAAVSIIWTLIPARVEIADWLNSSIIVAISAMLGITRPAILAKRYQTDASCAARAAAEWLITRSAVKTWIAETYGPGPAPRGYPAIDRYDTVSDFHLQPPAEQKYILAEEAKIAAAPRGTMTPVDILIKYDIPLRTAMAATAEFFRICCIIRPPAASRTSGIAAATRAARAIQQTLDNMAYGLNASQLATELRALAPPAPAAMRLPPAALEHIAAALSSGGRIEHSKIFPPGEATERLARRRAIRQLRTALGMTAAEIKNMMAEAKFALGSSSPKGNGFATLAATMFPGIARTQIVKYGTLIVAGHAALGRNTAPAPGGRVYFPAIDPISTISPAAADSPALEAFFADPAMVESILDEARLEYLLRGPRGPGTSSYKIAKHDIPRLQSLLDMNAFFAPMRQAAGFG